MSNLTKGTPPQPYGQGGRLVYLPMKASAQVYQGAMLAEISGAVCTGTTAGAGRCIGVAEADALGGASDGASRVAVWTDKIFKYPAGTNAPTDATPFGTPLFMEDDNHVGTGGIGGTGEGFAGLFMGMEDDGRVRVFIGALASDKLVVNGTAGTDTATQTPAVVLARSTRYKIPAQSQNTSITLSTTGAVIGDEIDIVSVNTNAHTVAVVDGGPGTPTLATLVASKVGFVKAYFDGTNWQLDSCSGT